ncbi:hypothetical protein HDE_07223 [Halotydeus destructor]|nr:hypothetical protein HDE_07223 [Halotydeus destructor]
MAVSGPDVCESPEEYGECRRVCQDDRDCSDMAKPDCGLKCKKACQRAETVGRCRAVLLTRLLFLRERIDSHSIVEHSSGPMPGGGGGGRKGGRGGGRKGGGGRRGSRSDGGDDGGDGGDDDGGGDGEGERADGGPESDGDEGSDNDGGGEGSGSNSPRGRRGGRGGGRGRGRRGRRGGRGPGSAGGGQGGSPPVRKPVTSGAKPEPAAAEAEPAEKKAPINVDVAGGTKEELVDVNILG